ncbi:MAG: hypothetical protein ABS873_08155, partial [Alkalibacterium sp.]
FKGERYDVGDKFGFLKTTIQYGLKHPQVKDDLKKYILDLSKELEDGSIQNNMDPEAHELEAAKEEQK